MQCKQCGYRLWNINSRQCPECGKDFKPTDYDFVPSSVAFCCPHCDQTYYGTSQRGHLVPEAFECVQCQKHIHMDETVLRPTVGYEERHTRIAQNPWAERQPGKSTIMAWLRTSSRALFRPTELMLRDKPESGLSPAVSFLCFNTMMTSLCGLGIFVALTRGMGYGANSVYQTIIGILGGLFVLVLASILLMLFLVFIWSGITHGMLKLMGKPQGQYMDTFDCISFANGTTVMTALPICGMYGLSWIAAIWWPISAAQILAKKHAMSVVKSLIAVSILPMLFFVGMSGAVGYAIYDEFRTFDDNLQQASAESIGKKILAHVNEDKTIGPRHVFAYILAKPIREWDWEMGDMNQETWSGGFQEGCSELSSMLNGEKRDNQKWHKDQITKVLDELPTIEGPGYRFGSMLFVYNKVTTDKLDPNLWLIVHWPRNSKPDEHAVFKADGTQVMYATIDLLNSLDEQDALRRKLDLPEIDSLDKIRIVSMPLQYQLTTHKLDPPQLDLAGRLLEVKHVDGRIGPDHVLRLLLDEKLATQLFEDVDADQWNYVYSPPMVGEQWHRLWVTNAKDQEKTQLIKELDDLPARDGVGYRFGQMVMLYDGIKQDMLDENLWLAVRWPKSYSPEQTRIYLANGKMIHVLKDDMPRLLVEQDDLRKKLGLKMIVDLNMVPEVALDIAVISNEDISEMSGFQFNTHAKETQTPLTTEQIEAENKEAVLPNLP